MKIDTPLTAEELLARIAEHDEGALGELYDRFAPAMLGLVVRIVAERTIAEEILQDVFARVASDARRLSKERVSVNAALVLLSRALAIERLRATRAAPSPAPTGQAELARPTARTAAAAERVPKPYAWLPAPAAIELVDGRRSLFQKVINQLPKPQREMMDLVLFDGYTEADIAQKLGEPTARVRSGLLAGASFIRHRLAAVMRTWAANI